MLSKSLWKACEFNFTVATKLGIVPYDYDSQRKYLCVSQKSYKLVLPLIIGTVFSLRALFLLFKLALSGEKWREDIQGTCLLGLQFIILWNNARYQFNTWMGRHEVAWAFKQISKFMEGVKLPEKSTFSEKNMITWTPGHVNIMMTFLLDLIFHPNGNQHLLTMIPAGNRINFFWPFLLFDFFTFFSFVWTAMFEYSVQTYLLRSLIYWSRTVSEEFNTEWVDLEVKIAKYKSCTIVLESLNRHFGVVMEQIKTTFIVYCVVSNYILIRYRDILGPSLIGFLVSCIIFCHTFPPLLYQDGYKVNEYSMEARRMLHRSVAKIRTAEKKLVCRKKIRALVPLQVRVPGLYPLERTMTPTYLWAIFNCTCTVLLS